MFYTFFCKEPFDHCQYKQFLYSIDDVWIQLRLKFLNFNKMRLKLFILFVPCREKCFNTNFYSEFILISRECFWGNRLENMLLCLLVE